jgi:hypothetical protein
MAHLANAWKKFNPPTAAVIHEPSLISFLEGQASTMQLFDYQNRPIPAAAMGWFHCLAVHGLAAAERAPSRLCDLA